MKKDAGAVRGWVYVRRDVAVGVVRGRVYVRMDEGAVVVRGTKGQRAVVVQRPEGRSCT